MRTADQLISGLKNVSGLEVSVFQMHGCQCRVTLRKIDSSNVSDFFRDVLDIATKARELFMQVDRQLAADFHERVCELLKIDTRCSDCGYTVNRLKWGDGSIQAAAIGIPRLVAENAAMAQLYVKG